MLIAQTTEAVRVTTAQGETLVVYIDVFRDSDSSEIVAADAKVKNAHGTRLPMFLQFLRVKRNALVRADRSWVVAL